MKLSPDESGEETPPEEPSAPGAAHHQGAPT